MTKTEIGFYSTSWDDKLRLGDVIRGVLLSYPRLKDVLADRQSFEFSLELQSVEHYVVLTPCCSIGERQHLLVSPLERIGPGILKNDHLRKEPTILNKMVEAKLALPSKEWEALPPETKADRESTGLGYTYLNLFGYAPHSLIPTYEVTYRGETWVEGHYVVDFQNATRVRCESLRQNSTAPGGMKVLQISAQARQDLRQKISSYFGRITDEDSAELSMS